MIIKADEKISPYLTITENGKILGYVTMIDTDKNIVEELVLDKDGMVKLKDNFEVMKSTRKIKNYTISFKTDVPDEIKNQYPEIPVL